MKRVLDITLAVEILIAAWWTVAWASETGSSGIAVLGWFTAVVIAYAIAFVVGALAAWRRPALRPRAMLVMAMPFIGGSSPGLLRLLTGGPVAPGLLGAAGLVVLGGAFALGVLRPRQTVRWVPHALFRSRAWNLLLVAPLALAWCLPLGLGAWLAAQSGGDVLGGANRTAGSGMAIAGVILLVASYQVRLGFAATLIAAWGWLGLAGGVDGAQRRLHWVQLVGAVPGILVAFWAWGWFAGQR